MKNEFGYPALTEKGQVVHFDAFFGWNSKVPENRGLMKLSEKNIHKHGVPWKVRLDQAKTLIWKKVQKFYKK